ncbi:MAG: MarR family transcriptional regulator [Solirubrobacteraceae bacterium]
MESVLGAARARQLDEIAAALPQRAGSLGRLFLEHTSLRVCRTEVDVLRALHERPQRITDLAAMQGVTQPAITLLVNRLEKRGWMERRPDPDDRRAVLVALTEPGQDAFARLRAEYRELVGEEMAALDDDAVEVLARAVSVLDLLIERLKARARLKAREPREREP